MKNEVWKDIRGYEKYYQISNLGRVRSLDRIIKDEKNNRTFNIKGKIITPTDNGNGYLIIGLRKNGKRKNKYIHRLVAEAFLDKCDGQEYINHIDFNKKNNNISNLEWCTQKENINYSIKKGRYISGKKETINKINKKLIKKEQELESKILYLWDNDVKNIDKISDIVHLNFKSVKKILQKNDRKKKIKCIETGEVFETIKEANKKYNVTTIKDTISGKQKTSAGFHWIRYYN